MRNRRQRRVEWKDRWKKYKRLYKGSRDERREKWRSKWAEYVNEENEVG